MKNSFKISIMDIMDYNSIEYEIMDPEESYSKKFLVK